MVRTRPPTVRDTDPWPLGRIRRGRGANRFLPRRNAHAARSIRPPWRRAMGQPEPESFTARYPQRGRAPAEAVGPPRHPEPLPAPTGQLPYRVDLESLLPADEISE